MLGREPLTVFDGRVTIVGRGRAGGSFARALRDTGVHVEILAGRAGATDPIQASGADLVLLCVPDGVIDEVAASIASSDAVIAHVSGATTLAPLRTHHERVASIHPLIALPNAERGGALLRAGATFAVAGDPIAAELVEHLGGTAVTVSDQQRAIYHATAAVAANHLVALTGQVERLATQIGVPVAAYLDLMQGALDAVRAEGAAAALTGPVMRGDWDTIEQHLSALPADERAAYCALANEAARLAGREWPDHLKGEE